MKITNIKRKIAGLALLVVAPNSFAEGPFFFASIGPSLTSIEDVDNDTGYKFGVGYNFTKQIYGKISYVDLGAFEADETGKQIFASGFSSSAGGSTDIDNLEFKISGFNVDVGAISEWSNGLSGFVELGFYSWDLEIDTSGFNTNLGSFSVSEDLFDGTGVSFGLGIAKTINQGLSATVEWEFFTTEDDIFDESHSLLSIGLSYEIGATKRK